ncbi:MAG: hypothetical protein P9C55_12525 [Defluviicoccus sp.]|nr:hypothetical protein [Defluviicoccus sp.]
MTRYDVAFVIEQALGHATHADNLRATIGTDQAIRPHWALIPFETFGISARIPFFASNWTVRAGIRARRALERLSRQTRLDAVFIHTQVPALLCTGWLRRLPGFVSLDATPIQVMRWVMSMGIGRVTTGSKPSSGASIGAPSWPRFT